MLELILPYPPSANHYKTVGRTVKTKSGKVFQMRVNSKQTLGYYYSVYLAWHRLNAAGFGSATITLEVDVYPPDKRKRDLDGILKVLLDSMQHAGVYDDDYQIARLLVTRKAMIPEGQIIVRLEELQCT